MSILGHNAWRSDPQFSARMAINVSPRQRSEWPALSQEYQTAYKPINIYYNNRRNIHLIKLSFGILFESNIHHRI